MSGNYQRNTQTQNEEALWIKDFLRGKTGSFDKLVLKYQDAVFRLCFHMTGNDADADDCAQETFIKAYKGLRGFKFRSAFSTWLYRIAINTCKSMVASPAYRFRQHAVSVDANPGGEEGLAPLQIPNHRTPELLLAQKETMKAILKAISSLPQKYKVPVVLYDMEGKSYEDISRITGLKMGTIKSRLARARQFLRRKLKGVAK
ncbi:MAG: sigma-70 family RNA polymerase sigma factor [Bacillota bacterium]